MNRERVLLTSNSNRRYCYHSRTLRVGAKNGDPTNQRNMIICHLKGTVLGFLLVLSTFFVVAQETSTTRSIQNPWQSEIDRLHQQIRIGEYASGLTQGQNLVGEVEEEFGLYHEYLIDPLLVVGDALLGLSESDQALAVYDRALQIERTASGPASLQQQTVLRKIGWANSTIGNFQDATRVYEKSYAISLSHYGAENPQLLPDSVRLFKWYEEQGKHFQAALLSIKILELSHRVPNFDSNQMIELKRLFAKTMRDATFPPQREFGSPRFVANLPGFDWVEFRRLPSFYRMGVHTLYEVKKQLENTKQVDLNLYVTTLLELADFHQAARRTAYSLPLYSKVWDLLSDAPNLRDRIFSQPKLLYIGLPKVSDPAHAEFPLGQIELNLTIASNGRVVGRRTLSTNPRDDVREHLVRVAARSASFRPAFVNAEPIRSKNILFTHYYPLQTSRY